MARPRDGRCRNIKAYRGGRPVRCGRRLPREATRNERTIHTDVCDRCATVKLATFYRSAAGRAWLARWRAVMGDLEHLAREMGVAS